MYQKRRMIRGLKDVGSWCDLLNPPTLDTKASSKSWNDSHVFCGSASLAQQKIIEHHGHVQYI